jgi:acyl-CoA synthetase (AMP-forming)/AMP-acid ligase II
MSPLEVEKVILQHENVLEVSVIGVPDAEWGEAIKAVCVRRAGKTLDARQIIDFVATRIARCKKPKYVVLVDALPKTKEGEVDRGRVKKSTGRRARNLGDVCGNVLMDMERRFRGPTSSPLLAPDP